MTEHEILLCHVLGCRPLDLILHKPLLTPAQQDQLDILTKRRYLGEPLQYILGSWDFFGLPFQVTPDVLVPRPETETLVLQALDFLKECPDPTIVDFGTGSGCIALTIAKFHQKANVIAVDISEKALALARMNGGRIGVKQRVNWVKGDMTDERFYSSLCAEHSVDLVVANPPYIPTAQMGLLPTDVQHEPRVALDGGHDGVYFHENLIKLTPRLLRAGGCLMMEFGDGQSIELRRRGKLHFRHIEIYQDLSGKDRVIACKGT